MRSFDQGSIRAQRESIAAGNDPKGEEQSDKSSFPTPLFFYKSLIRYSRQDCVFLCPEKTENLDQNVIRTPR